jgi:glycosyltransferase involved in cell wall biosynthesis
MYDVVFLTHLPSFYKVNLYRELSKSLKIYVIFLGGKSSIRTDDFVSENLPFDHVFFSRGEFERRNRFETALDAIRHLRMISYRKMVVGGWDAPEFWLSLLMSPRLKNALALESSAFESTSRGLKGFMKKIFLSRVSIVFASGTAHRRLLSELGFCGRIVITKGVGLINTPAKVPNTKSFQGKFLYLGRLSPEKNLEILLQAFKGLEGYTLTIAGNGPQIGQLKDLGLENVRFLGHIENSRISALFEEHDFLVLPSVREPWGLVVEEALAHGRPVLVSNRCGSADLVDHENGRLFDAFSVDSLRNVILSIDEEIFHGMQLNIRRKHGQHEQVASYLAELH